METGFCLFHPEPAADQGYWGAGGWEEAAKGQERASLAQPQEGVFPLAFLLFLSTPAPIPIPGLWGKP